MKNQGDYKGFIVLSTADYTPDGKQIILSGDVDELKMQIVLKKVNFGGYQW
jgi:hypothetical protein